VVDEGAHRRVGTRRPVEGVVAQSQAGVLEGGRPCESLRGAVDWDDERRVRALGVEVLFTMHTKIWREPDDCAGPGWP